MCPGNWEQHETPPRASTRASATGMSAPCSRADQEQLRHRHSVRWFCEWHSAAEARAARNVLAPQKSDNRHDTRSATRWTPPTPHANCVPNTYVHSMCYLATLVDGNLSHSEGCLAGAMQLSGILFGVWKRRLRHEDRGGRVSFFFVPLFKKGFLLFLFLPFFKKAFLLFFCPFLSKRFFDLYFLHFF